MRFISSSLHTLILLSVAVSALPTGTDLLKRQDPFEWRQQNMPALTGVPINDPRVQRIFGAMAREWLRDLDAELRAGNIHPENGTIREEATLNMHALGFENPPQDIELNLFFFGMDVQDFVPPNLDFTDPAGVDDNIPNTFRHLLLNGNTGGMFAGAHEDGARFAVTFQVVRVEGADQAADSSSSSSEASFDRSDGSSVSAQARYTGDLGGTAGPSHDQLMSWGQLSMTLLGAIAIGTLSVRK